jgi:methylated-DNA-protein-cysteine methyltransferase-like protein
MKKKTGNLPKMHSDFYRNVYEVVRLIPRGRVSTYGAIAAFLGTKSSSRVVGYALNQAALGSIDVPAHRVVNRNGLLTGKHHFPPEFPMETSLRNEGIEVVDDQVKDFGDKFWDPSIEIGL